MVKTRFQYTEWGKRWFFNDVADRYKFAMYIYSDDPDKIYLSNVFVKPEYRRYGLGNCILSDAECVAKENNASEIILKVLKDTFVHDWYSRHGYKDYCIEPESEYVWMRKVLNTQE